MPVDFYLANPTLTIPSLARLRLFWSNVPNDKVREEIASTHQYLNFQRMLLKQLRFTAAGEIATKPWTKELDLSLRAGAVRAAVLLCASMVEAVLRDHAEKRGYSLKADPRRRTFGNVLSAWRPSGIPRPEIAAFDSALTNLHVFRNTIHLHQAANNPAAYWNQVLKQENAMLTEALSVLKHLRTLSSP